MKRYKIVRIDEADYGCEGRPDGEEAMDSVWLEDENGAVSYTHLRAHET